HGADKIALMTVPGAQPCAVAADDKVRVEGLRQSRRERRLAAAGRSRQQNSVVDIAPADIAAPPVLDVLRQLTAPVRRRSKAVHFLEVRRAVRNDALILGLGAFLRVFALLFFLLLLLLSGFDL